MGKKFINDPENITKELLEGLCLAFPDIIELGGSNKKLVINKKLKDADRVGIVSLGGTGHEPALSGVVGEGMLDIAVAGDIFAAPGPQDIVEAIRMADRGKGVLLIVLNHSGDMLAGKAALKMAKKANLNVNMVVTQEDIGTEPRSNADNRRGMVGCVPLYHIAGAAAAKGMNLDEITQIAQRFADNMAALAVANKGATHPSTGLLISDFGDDEMEIGVGQHGEGGGGRMKMLSADDTAEIMLNRLIQDLHLSSGDETMLIINGAGATTIMELCIVFRKCYQLLIDKGIKVVASYAGDMLTSQEQAGFQMFLARVDAEIKGLWDEPCRTPYYSR